MKIGTKIYYNNPNDEHHGTIGRVTGYSKEHNYVRFEASLSDDDYDFVVEKDQIIEVRNLTELEKVIYGLR